MNYDYSSDEAFLMSLIRYSADKRLEKTHVHITGNEPYVWSYVSQWVQHLGGICRDPYTLPYWPGILDELDAGHTEETILGLKEGRNYLEKLSYVVIGRQNFNKAFLAICLHYQRVFDYRCVSQEYFLELIKYNRVREYYPGDPRISLHPRLSFLAEVGFQWPSIEAYPSYDTLRTYNGNLADVSELRMLGYSVAKDVSEEERRRALKFCVERYGLQHVAAKVGWFTRMRKGRWDDIMREAIYKYEADRELLRRKYYVNSRFSFRWPSTDI